MTVTMMMSARPMPATMAIFTQSSWQHQSRHDVEEGTLWGGPLHVPLVARHGFDAQTSVIFSIEKKFPQLKSHIFGFEQQQGEAGLRFLNCVSALFLNVFLFIRGCKLVACQASGRRVAFNGM
jgi:hypothetical protein